MDDGTLPWHTGRGVSLANHRRPASGTASSTRVRDTRPNHPLLARLPETLVISNQTPKGTQNSQAHPRPCVYSVPYLPDRPSLIQPWCTHWPSPRHDRIHDVTTSSAASPIFKRLARASFGLMVSPCSLFLFSCHCSTLLSSHPSSITLLRFFCIFLFPHSSPFLVLGSCVSLSLLPE